MKTGFTRRPEYYGMLAAKEFAGATLVQSRLECGNDKVRAYAAVKDGARMVLAINKTEQAVAMKVPVRRSREWWRLSGPAIDAKETVSLTQAGGNAVRDGVLHVDAHSAVLIRA